MNQHALARGVARRSASVLTALALTAGGAAVLASAAPAHAAPQPISNAELTWGVNGYAQIGVANFGPWRIENLTGNVSKLTGSVSGGSQTEYETAPFPATSFPASQAGKTPNAVKFTGGTGTADVSTGAMTLSWTGSYTTNGYPVGIGAPGEVYSDPELTIAADGSGSLTMEVQTTEGAGMGGGGSTPATDLGRVTLLSFAAGSDTRLEDDAFRLTPSYQGVVNGETDQATTCTSPNVWGSWPAGFVTAMPDSLSPHYYGTGCGGLNDNKAALPLDVDFNTTPEVTVSKTTLLPNGAQQVTVTGAGFDPAAAIGTRPPLSGQQAGAYVIFGKFADLWRPSQSAPSSSRKVVQQLWALPPASIAQLPPAAQADTVELSPQGGFTATLTVDKAAADAASETGNYGIYTYAGSGAVVPTYETSTPITFAKATPKVELSAKNPTYGADVPVTVKVSGDSSPTGSVTLKDGDVVVGTATLSGGSALFTLTKPGAGTHALTASYAGDPNTESGSAAATLTVAKATGSVKVKVTKVPKPKKKGKAVVTVASDATGNVTAVLRTKKGKKVTTLTSKITGGQATLKLPKLAKGKYSLTVKHAGDANVTKAGKKKNLRVK